MGTKQIGKSLDGTVGVRDNDLQFKANEVLTRFSVTLGQAIREESDRSVFRLFA
jgi:hypothetical protein